MIYERKSWRASYKTFKATEGETALESTKSVVVVVYIYINLFVNLIVKSFGYHSAHQKDRIVWIHTAVVVVLIFVRGVEEAFVPLALKAPAPRRHTLPLVFF
jgi:hypothetical protein